jgi:anti-sigma regulatory factor (Ser/Thr protein kinase)
MSPATGRSGPGPDGDGRRRREVRQMPGVPAAVDDARRWVATTLDGWPARRVEAARLLVSEVVTNAVLHARTDVEVRVELDDRTARVEVADRSPVDLVPKRYQPDAATGRGLRLLATLADRWGVRRSSGGKVVWFELGREEGAGTVVASRGGLDDVVEASLATDHDGGPESPGTATTEDVVEVRILRVPVELYLETEQHNDAVMRELALITHSTGAPTDAPAVHRRLLELGVEVRAAFATSVPQIRLQVDEAVRLGSAMVDLRLAVPVSGWQAFLRLAEQLDEADRFCEDGDLVTLVASPAVRRFRHWYAGQVAAQVAGGPPEPWPGPDDHGDGAAR